MDRCGKMNKGWYVAGLILAAILLLMAAAGFVLGVCAFDTADYPMIGETGIYPAGDCEILPEGAAAVVRASETPERGLPAAYFDGEEEHIRIKYYYGEEDGKIILTNEDSEDVSEIAPEQLRGCVKSYIPLLGYLLGWICTLGGVCTTLAAGILLMMAVLWIALGLARVMRHNKSLRPAEEGIFMEETIEGPAESMKEEMPAMAEEPASLICGCEMSDLPDEQEGRCGKLFCGEAADVLKLSKIFRAAAEKRGAASVVAEEQYGETCQLKVTYLPEDAPLAESVIAMLKERK